MADQRVMIERGDMVPVMLRLDEAEYLSGSPRCWTCLHLEVFHAEGQGSASCMLITTCACAGFRPRPSFTTESRQ